MIHLLQSLKTGETELAEVPTPRATPSTLVVRSVATVISPGTERMLVDFGRAGWLEKARSQPEKVSQVLDKARSDGVGASLEAVRAKLDTPVAIGYCQAGYVHELGRGVTGFGIGDRVATNGPHAAYVRVAPTLVARIPESVSFEAAACAPLAAIGLHGLRLAGPGLGETVVVYGLGLIGLLTVQLARAAGCRVIGIDRSAERCTLASRFGADTVFAADDVDVVDAVLQRTEGIGADAVLLTLASSSDDPVRQAAAMSRKRGRIVLVGVTGLNLRRDDFYRKELSFQVSCSYGPGRYDPDHEEQGLDYPLPYVRWTEGRNFAAVLDLMADGRLDPVPLITHRFPVSEAKSAYGVVSDDGGSLGIVLTYPDDGGTSASSSSSVVLRTRSGTEASAARVGFIGAGNFAARVLIPAFQDSGASLEVIASSGGVSAGVVGRKHGFRRATTDGESVLDDPEVDTVVVGTRHDSHADWVIRALQAGKHVFVEKPLALTLDETRDIHRVATESGRLLCVGFNRRFSPHSQRISRLLKARSGPLVLSMTVNAGTIASGHWTHDPAVGGGRIVGEACHFIDLSRFLAGSPVASLQVTVARDQSGRVMDDTSLLQMSFADGSIATIQYFATGSRAFPKERLEAFFDGQALRIDNFRRVRAWGLSVPMRLWPAKQDKGHRQLVRAFVDAVRNGGPPPIPLEQLIEVSAASIIAARLAREGGGSADIAIESASNQ